MSFLHNVNFNILLSYFPGFQCKVSCAYLWELYGKKYVPSIYLCMLNHIGIKRILTGCLQSSIEFVSFWLKKQYFPGLLFRLPVSFCGFGMVKIRSIHQFMYVVPSWNEKNTYMMSQKFHRICIILAENYVKINNMQKRHLF